MWQTKLSPIALEPNLQLLNTLAKHLEPMSTLETPKKKDITFYGASDAAFADNKETRRSSQGYLFILFGGLIDWKATLQCSVT